MKGNDDVFDKRIWALLSGQLRDPKEIKEVAQVLNTEFVPRVIGVLKIYGVDEITGEEIAKEAIDKGVKTYRPGKAKFLTFVTRIALNLRIDRYRQGSLPNQTPLSLDDEDLKLQDVLSAPPDSLDPPEVSKFMRLVNSVAPMLSQEDRNLIQYDIQGVPKESYMTFYRLTDSAYRQRKLRAYERLRRLIEKVPSQKGES